MRRNLYRIDDILLRTGFYALFALLVAAGVVGLFGMAQGGSEGRDPAAAAWSALAQKGLPLAIGALCPAVLLTCGTIMRRREKRIAAIWSLLTQQVEIRVPELLANSDFRREDLERAVRFLNNGGHGHYVWDRRFDTIQDARLARTHFHVEECEACGAKLSLEIPLAFREIPGCPYCHAAISVALLEERRQAALDGLGETSRERSYGTSVSSSFSLPLFVLLLLAFWPAGLVYAWIKWQSGELGIAR